VVYRSPQEVAEADRTLGTTLGTPGRATPV
jgi:hypothetical protein